MIAIFDHVFDGKGIGWSVLRFALILAPAVLALIVLNITFPFD